MRTSGPIATIQLMTPPIPPANRIRGALISLRLRGGEGRRRGEERGREERGGGEGEEGRGGERGEEERRRGGGR